MYRANARERERQATPLNPYANRARSAPPLRQRNVPPERPPTPRNKTFNPGRITAFADPQVDLPRVAGAHSAFRDKPHTQADPLATGNTTYTTSLPDPCSRSIHGSPAESSIRYGSLAALPRLWIRRTHRMSATDPPIYQTTGVALKRRVPWHYMAAKMIYTRTFKTSWNGFTGNQLVLARPAGTLTRIWDDELHEFWEPRLRTHPPPLHIKF